MREFNLKISDSLLDDSVNGQKLKWYIEQDNEKLYIKAPSLNKYNKNWLYEQYSELIICRLIKELGNNNVVMYYPCKIILDDNTCIIGCYCNSFLKEDEKYISLASLCEENNSSDKYTLEGYQGYQNLIEDIKAIYKIDIKEWLDEHIEIDCITLNTDRHLGNLGLIYNYKTKQVRVAPIFDNGNALFSNKDISGFTYDFELDSICISRPFCYRHNEQIKLLNNRKYIHSKIDSTLNYIDELKQLGLDTNRSDFIKELLKTRIEYF